MVFNYSMTFRINRSGKVVCGLFYDAVNM
jgi:hypothetical protein